MRVLHPAFEILRRRLLRLLLLRPLLPRVDLLLLLLLLLRDLRRWMECARRGAERRDCVWNWACLWWLNSVLVW